MRPRETSFAPSLYRVSTDTLIIERCRDGCRTSLLIAGVVLVLAIFHTSLPLCHPYITIHFMEMIFSTCSTNFLLHVCHI